MERSLTNAARTWEAEMFGDAPLALAATAGGAGRVLEDFERGFVGRAGTRGKEGGVVAGWPGRGVGGWGRPLAIFDDFFDEFRSRQRAGGVLREFFDEVAGAAPVGAVYRPLALFDEYFPGWYARTTPSRMADLGFTAGGLRDVFADAERTLAPGVMHGPLAMFERCFQPLPRMAGMVPWGRDAVFDAFFDDVRRGLAGRAWGGGAGAPLAAAALESAATAEAEAEAGQGTRERKRARGETDADAVARVDRFQRDYADAVAEVGALKQRHRRAKEEARRMVEGFFGVERGAGAAFPSLAMFDDFFREFSARLRGVGGGSAVEGGEGARGVLDDFFTAAEGRAGGERGAKAVEGRREPKTVETRRGEERVREQERVREKVAAEPAG